MKFKNIFISLFFSFLFFSFFIKSFSGEALAWPPVTGKVFSIAGTIDFGQNTGKLSPIFSYNGNVFNDLKPGEYTVELLDRNNSILLQQSFQPQEVVATLYVQNIQKQFLYTQIINFLCRVSFLRRFNLPCPSVDAISDRGGGGGIFTLRIPYIEEVAVVRLKHNSKILDQLKPGTNFPHIKIDPVTTKQLPNAGEFKLTWSANDSDGDKVYYLALLSTDNQKTWKTISSGVPYPQLSLGVSQIPKSDSIYFQVRASDGINTSADTIGPFKASIKIPVAEITNPKDGDSIQQGYPIILLGSGNSAEEENTIPDERLTWSSNISGVLGNGQTLQVEKTLPKGKHVITLTVTDKFGNKSSKSINLVIK